MKKLTVKLLALALVIASVFSLASCSLFTPKPPKDLDDAKKALEKADYSVSYSDDLDEPGIKEYFYAYNEDGDRLTVIVFEDAKLANLYYKQLQLEQKYDKEDTQLEIKFNQHMLKKYEDDMKNDEIDAIEDQIKELKKDLEDMKKEDVIGKSGKTVWYGTKDAIKDAK